MEFYHCADDIERCVKGSNKKWVQGVRPPIPSMWPVLKGTKLTKGEIIRLEQAGFQLEERRAISLRRLFGSNRAAVDAAVPLPNEPDCYPSIRDGRRT